MAKKTGTDQKAKQSSRPPMTLLPVREKDLPEDDTGIASPQAIKKFKGVEDYDIWRAGSRHVAVAPSGKNKYTVCWLEDGAKDLAVSSLAPAEWYAMNDLRRDGSAALVVKPSREIHEVELPSGKSARLWTTSGDDEITQVLYVGDALVALVGATLRLLVRDGATARQTSSVDVEAEKIYVHPTVPVVLAIPTTMGPRAPTVAYGVYGDRLEEIGTPEPAIKVSSIQTLRGRPFVSDATYQRFELTGVEAAYGGESSVAAAAAPPAAASPYAFFGRRPGDWMGELHEYELLFREPPDAAARTAIARAFATSVRKTTVKAAAGKAWFWSGPWLKIVLEEKKPGAANDGRFWQDVQSVIDTIHDAAPLAEVVYWGALADAAKPKSSPSAGPVYPGVVAPTYYGQKRDKKLPAPEEDEEFSSALRKALKGR